MMHYNKKDAFITIKVKEFALFMAQVFSKIKAIESLAVPMYKIVDWIELDGIGYCVALITGTDVTENHRPSDILKNKALLRKFEQEDVVAITNFCHYENLRPKTTICSVDCEADKVTTKGLDGKEESYSLSEIKNDKDFFEKLSKKDVFHIARMIGQSDMDI